MIHVYNSKTEDHSSSANNYYIGRPSILGNPFGVKGKRASLAKLTFPTREEAINAYKIYFKEMYGKDADFTRAFDEIYNKYKNGEEIYLQCFCKPLPCHGDVLKQELEKKLIREMRNKKG